MTFKVEMSKEKIAFIQKNEKTYNLSGITYFVYYKCFQREVFNKAIYIIILGTPHLLYKRGFEFLKFSKKREEGAQNFPIKREKLVKQGVVVLETRSNTN